MSTAVEINLGRSHTHSAASCAGVCERLTRGYSSGHKFVILISTLIISMTEGKQLAKNTKTD